MPSSLFIFQFRVAQNMSATLGCMAHKRSATLVWTLPSLEISLGRFTKGLLHGNGSFFFLEFIPWGGSRRVCYVGTAPPPPNFALAWLTKGLLWWDSAFLLPQWLAKGLYDATAPSSSKFYHPLAHKKSATLQRHLLPLNFTLGLPGLLRWRILNFLL